MSNDLDRFPSNLITILDSCSEIIHSRYDFIHWINSFTLNKSFRRKPKVSTALVDEKSDFYSDFGHGFSSP